MSDHEHTREKMLPLWRSDLAGDVVAGRWYAHALRHGWWCKICGAVSRIAQPSPQIGKAPAWEVRLLPGLGVVVKAPDPLDGVELMKFAASVEAADREATRRRDVALAESLGHVGWRLSDDLVIWHWQGANYRQGCSLVGIKPRVATKCSVCQEAIEAGHACWRGDGDVRGLSSMSWSHVRVCVRCIATLPRESLTEAGPTRPASGGRRVAPLRLIDNA